MSGGMVMMYGGPPKPRGWPPENEPESPRTQPLVPVVVYPEAVAKQLRELKEMIQALRGDKSEVVTPSEMVRRMLGAVVDADPQMLTVIEEFLKERGVR